MRVFFLAAFPLIKDLGVEKSFTKELHLCLEMSGSAPDQQRMKNKPKTLMQNYREKKKFLRLLLKNWLTFILDGCLWLTYVEIQKIKHKIAFCKKKYL